MPSKRGIEAGRAYVSAFLDDSKLVRGLKRAHRKLASFGAGLGKVGAVTLGAGLTAGALGLQKVLDSISQTDQINKVAKAFGLATEQASGLMGVFAAAGAGNVRENVESLVTMSDRVQQAMTGEGQGAELFAGLNVSAKELSKLSLDEQFFRLHAAIKELPDPVDRVNRLMLAFGEDGGKTLIGTLSKSTSELRQQAAGMRISAEEAQAATEAQASMNRASAAFAAIWRTIASVLAPVIERFANWLSQTGRSVAKNEKLAKTLVLVVAGITAGGAALLTLGGTIIGLVAILGGLGTAIGLLFSPTGLLLVGIAAAGVALYKFSSIGKEVSGILKAAFGSIADALLAGDIAGAAKVLWATLDLLWAKGCASLMGIWLQLTSNMAKSILDVYSNIGNGWNRFQRTASKGWAKVFGGLADFEETMQGIFGKPEGHTLGDTFRMMEQDLNHQVGERDQITADSIMANGRAKDALTAMTNRRQQRLMDDLKAAQEEFDKVRESVSEDNKAPVVAAKPTETQSNKVAQKDAEKEANKEALEGERSRLKKQLGDMRERARNTANTAAIAGSSTAASAIAAAIRPRPQSLTPDGKSITDKLAEVNAKLAELNRGKLVVTETKGR